MWFRHRISRTFKLKHDKEIEDSIRAHDEFAEGFVNLQPAPFDLDGTQHLTESAGNFLAAKAETSALASEVAVPARFWEIMNQRKILLAMLLQQTTSVESAVRGVQRRFRRYMRMKWSRRIRNATAEVVNQIAEEVEIQQQRAGVADKLKSSLGQAQLSFVPEAFENCGGRAGTPTAVGLTDPVTSVRLRTAQRISEVTAAIQHRKRVSVNAALGRLDCVSVPRTTSAGRSVASEFRLRGKRVLLQLILSMVVIGWLFQTFRHRPRTQRHTTTRYQ